MPKGPRGEKRPADVIGNSVQVMRIATGEVEEANDGKDPHAKALGGKGGERGSREQRRRSDGNNLTSVQVWPYIAAHQNDARPQWLYPRTEWKRRLCADARQPMQVRSGSVTMLKIKWWVVALTGHLFIRHSAAVA